MNKRGVTLLEALVVVTIIAILATMIAPDFLSWLHHYRLHGAVVTMTNHFRAARLLAIFTQKPHQIQLKKFDEGNYYQVVEKSGTKTGDKLVTSIGRVSLTQRFGEVRIIGLPSSGRITFKPQGTAETATVEMENNAGERVKIVVNSFGRIRNETS